MKKATTRRAKAADMYQDEQLDMPAPVVQPAFVPAPVSSFRLGQTQILVGLLIGAAFFTGTLYTKVQYLEKGAPATAPAVAGAQAPTGPQATPGKVDVAVGHFPVRGDKNAKVTVVEFADFRCPFCEKTFTSVDPQLQKEYIDTGKVKFAFRQYAFLGPASTVAANAAECASDQNKFWEMHDYLYKNQPAESDTTMYTTDKLTEIAGQLGLDTANFRSCLDAKKFDKNVNDDFTAGQQAGVNGTPAFFINGLPIVGAQPYTAFKSAIDAELAKK
jgi:protein-disulfide isomerase